MIHGWFAPFVSHNQSGKEKGGDSNSKSKQLRFSVSAAWSHCRDLVLFDWRIFCCIICWDALQLFCFACDGAKFSVCRDWNELHEYIGWGWVEECTLFHRMLATRMLLVIDVYSVSFCSISLPVYCWWLDSNSIFSFWSNSRKGVAFFFLFCFLWCLAHNC